MKPTPDEIAASLRSLIREHVSPELSPGGQAYIKRIMFVLRDARWNESAFDLLNENAVLANLIDACRVHAAGEQQTADLHATLCAASAEFTTTGTPRSFAEANALNACLRAALAQFIDAMRDGGVRDSDALATRIIETLARLQTPGAATA